MAEPINVDQPILEVQPNTITFKFIPDKDIPVELRLKNLTQKPVMFKVKTTAPDHYQVRPIISTIGPGKTEVCVIVLRAMSQMPENPKDLRHKFLVQSAEYIEDEGEDLQTRWRKLESMHKKVDGQPTYHDQRFTCQIVPNTPAENTSPQDLEQCREENAKLLDHTLSMGRTIKQLTSQVGLLEKEKGSLKDTVVQLEKEINQLKANAAKASASVTGAVVVAGDGGKTLTLPLWQIIAIAVIAFLLGSILF